ncbi:unnamed protein product [Larinioides sclopetarius]|uniref:Uncharacterized protein n=1 Tax=Larinioides sclopetarius TaxID=280406 RepID=A0AAV2B601_9ARAC
MTTSLFSYGFEGLGYPPLMDFVKVYLIIQVGQ